jgi:hypothetical protein
MLKFLKEQGHLHNNATLLRLVSKVLGVVKQKLNEIKKEWKLSYLIHLQINSPSSK